jgi:hypothetical protein
VNEIASMGITTVLSVFLIGSCTAWNQNGCDYRASSTLEKVRVRVGWLVPGNIRVRVATQLLNCNCTTTFAALFLRSSITSHSPRLALFTLRGRTNSRVQRGDRLSLHLRALPYSEQGRPTYSRQTNLALFLRISGHRIPTIHYSIGGGAISLLLELVPYNHILTHSLTTAASSSDNVL